MEQLMTTLKLARIREVYPHWLEIAANEQMSYSQFLEGLLSEEVVARAENQTQRRLKSADFPFEKTIEQFDFSFRPELKRQVILNCMDPTFIHKGKSLVLIGPPGVGKTHLAIAIGIKLIQIGLTVKFVEAQKLINDYLASENTDSTEKFLNSLAKVDLLIIDEFGYLPHSHQIGPLFYQIIADRYEKKSTIITSNKALAAWASVLHDSSLAAALIDRLMHHGEVFYLSGESYRLRGKQKYLSGNLAESGSQQGTSQTKGGDTDSN